MNIAAYSSKNVLDRKQPSYLDYEKFFFAKIKTPFRSAFYTMSSIPEEAVVKIHISPDLQAYACPPSTYLSSHSQYSTLGVGAFIFAHASDSPPLPTSPRLLIVQRAATETGFPNLWEVPGGGVESSDPTIFHSVARETFEETGLKLTRIIREIGDGNVFPTRSGKLCKKFNFEIEVATTHDSERQGGMLHGGHSISDYGALIKLDPVEHQAYAWLSEAELHQNTYPITTPDHRQVLIDAFAAFHPSLQNDESAAPAETPA